MIIRTNSAEETIEAGRKLAENLTADCNNCAVLLCGDMGAGKTNFTKGIAAGLGITSTITSPTFALVNEYYSDKNRLFHFDLFRINSADDLYAIGFYDYIGRGLIVCEWSENVADLENEFEFFYKVEIKKIGENIRFGGNEREIHVTART